MARKVSVGLEADVAGFIGPVDAAAHATEKLDDHVNELDRSLNKIPADALKAGAAMKLLSGDVKDVGTNFQAVGDKSTAMTILDNRIRSTRAEVKKLGEEFVKTGDVDVFHKLTRATGDLSALTDIRKKLSNSIESGLKDGVAQGGTKAATTFSSLIQGGIIEALSNPAVLTAVGIIGIPLAAMLTAAIGGAITGAVALGVVGAGVAGAVMGDPKRIGAEWDKQISALKTKFISASSSFVDPTIAGIRQIGKAVQGLDLEGIFKRASEFVGPLSNGLSKFIPSLGRMVEAFISGAGPVIDKIAEKLPQIGQALETFAKDVTGDSKDAADALGRIIDVIDGIIVGTGKIIHAAEVTWGAIRKADDSVEGFMRHLQQTNGLFTALFTVPLAATTVWRAALQEGSENFQQFGKDAADALSKVPDAAATAASNLKEDLASIDNAFSSLGKSVEGELTNKIIGSMFAVDHATLQWQESLAGLSDAAKQNGTSLDILNEKTGRYNEKALKNKEVLLAAAEANANMYAQNLLAGDSADVAGQKYEKNAEQLRKAAIAAGYNAKEVDNVIGKYGQVPEKVQTILATIGLTDALNKLGQILVDFRNLNDKDFKTKYTVTYTVNHVTHYDTTGQPGNSRQAGFALGGIRRAALGRIVAPSDPGTLIGEPQTGGEALIPLQGITQSKAMSLAQTVGQNYGFNVSPWGGNSKGMTLTIDFGGNTNGAFATAFMRLVRNGDIQFGVN